jgi:opacity protein-like surface antigen
MVTQTRSTRLVFCALAAALLAAAPAYADIRVTGFGGVTNVDDENKRTFGVAVTLSSLIGVEVEAARATLGGFSDVSIVDVEASLTTYMANAVVRAPLGPIQPYGSAGVGIVRVTGDLNVPFVGSVLSASAQDVGWNIGGGVYLLPTPNLGVRADVRRFQTGDIEWDDITGIGDLPLPKFDFWRATVGLTFKF